MLAHAAKIPPAAASSWLRTAVWNKARENRRQRRETLADVAPPADPDPGPEDTLASAQVSAAVRDAMERIAESRRTILAAVAEGQTQAAVAAEQGVPESTVRVRARDAAEELRGDLHRQRVAERRRTGGHSSWSVMALWGDARKSAATGVRALVAAFGAITMGGAPPTYLGPTPEDMPAVVVHVEPLVQPVTAQAERGVERPVAPVRQRARHDVPAHMLRQRLMR